MVKSNALRQAEYRERQRSVGRCVTGGCPRKAYPYRKCPACRRQEADRKAARRRQVSAEIQEIDSLREELRKREAHGAALQQRIAWLELALTVRTEAVEEPLGGVGNPREVEIVEGPDARSEDEMPQAGTGGKPSGHQTIRLVPPRSAANG